MEKNYWHGILHAEVVGLLNTETKTGLSEEEAVFRLGKYGKNQIESKKKISPWQIFFAQFKNLLVLILIAAALLSGFLGHIWEAVAVGIIVVFSAVMGFLQEYRAQLSLKALEKLAVPKSLVIRGGKVVEISSVELVPGDIAVLSAGSRVNADIRLIESYNLQIEESALTGESFPSEKNPNATLSADAALGDRVNMAYAGTTITYGRGIGVVVETGMQTEIGKIAKLLSEVVDEPTPLQVNLDALAKRLGVIALAVVVMIVVLGIFRSQSIVQMLLFGVSLAVAVVPEALPAVVTVSLALGASRMARRNALVKSMPVVESLGCTSVICTDKTGTLTKDEMTVEFVETPVAVYNLSGSGYEPLGKIFHNEKEIKEPGGDLKEVLLAGVLCNDAELYNENEIWVVRGDATEGALLVAGLKGGVAKEVVGSDYARAEEIPFSSEKKYMATMHEYSHKTVVFVKGALEVVLGMTGQILAENGVGKMSEAEKQKILKSAEKYSQNGKRVIALAKNHSLKDLKQDPSELVYLGFVAMADALRPEAKLAVETCKKAGIKTVMITGDHPATAAAIARQLGILSGAEDKVVLGKDIDLMSKQEFFDQILKTSVYARVSPEHKLMIVKALQEKGRVVAMTGDGVNDAPALRKADIGVAMGIKGTDVSKEAANMTLLDDNFASIVSAVEEGRIIFENIKKYLVYLLSAHVGEVVLIAGSVAFGLPLPLTSVQILYVNLACDGPPALALAGEKGSSDQMQRKPRDPKVGVFTRRTVVLMLVAAFWTTLLNIFTFIYFYRSSDSLVVAGTAIFASLILIQMFKAYSVKNDRMHLFKGIFSNKWLNLSVLAQIPLLWFLTESAVMQKIFSTVSLDASDWLILVLISLCILPVMELAKVVLNKKQIE
ncbi:MAG: cation-translocating P-type ATPase [Candidatus Doudnabacteria bacterium]|nr:cation-translocating P-type ATPase [Candidatus Doudnabacteria bacterium]